MMAKSYVVDDRSDQSKLTAWRTSSAVYIEVSGSRSSITQIGEQLAWLGGALRTSPFADLASCIPFIDAFPLVRKDHHELLIQDRQYNDHTLMIDFYFRKGNTDSEYDIDGRCWHNLFRNPTVVQGFPIMRRESPCDGLEIPLNMMAGLVGTARAQVFDDINILKGFSSMLIPSRQSEDVIVWHLLFNANGSRISYMRYDFSPLRQISFQHLQTSRHIVGWCSRIQSHAGKFNFSGKERMRIPDESYL